jgi:hypothetical protein
MVVFKYFIVLFFAHSLLHAGDFSNIVITALKVMFVGIAILIFFYILQAIEISRAQAKRKELSKKIPLFNTSDIGRNYIALGMVEWGANHQDIAVVKCLEQAQEMGASAIVNFQLATTTSVYGNAKKIDSHNSYFYTGTAVKYK